MLLNKSLSLNSAAAASRQTGVKALPARPATLKRNVAVSAQPTGAERPLWSPGSESPAWLDGT